MATDAQVNGLDSTDNNFWLTGVQMELGSVATPFESRSIQQELAMCQRYYEKSYDPAVAPGTTTTAGILTVIALSTTALTGQRYQVVKRAVPTVVFYSRNGTAGKVSTTAAGTDTGTACVVNTPGEAGFGGVYEASPYTGGVGYEYFFTASCEL
jgi:hypothetical protein